MKLIITGCNGQLGKELIRQLTCKSSEIGAIPAAYQHAKITAIDIEDLNIEKLQDAIEFVQKEAPDLIINCAAYTNVDGCETNQDSAFRANAIGPRNLAIAAQKAGAKLLQVSTDYVFPGDGTSPCTECEQPDPRSVYGKTKLAGENYVRAFCSRWFIVRTAWLYGYEGKNFVKTILRVAREKGAVRVVNDQLGNPTNAADLAHHILKIAATEEYGVYHCTGKGICSWYDFASGIVKYAGINAKVLPCTTEEYGSQTRRPAYSALDHAMLRATVGDEMREWEDALKYFMEHYQG